ncbi:MAG: glycosyltransferase [Gammaproteobacteria bacterium]|jgi:hypothetical protein|nr:glycosyltransferase [Gammaproteobacteria bacterium]
MLIEKQVAICLHNLILHDTLAPLIRRLIELNISFDICVPDNIVSEDKAMEERWQEMFQDTINTLKNKNLPIISQTEAAKKKYKIAFYPYLPYLVDVKAEFNFKYLYGFAKPEFTFGGGAVLFDLIFCASTYDQAFFETFAKTKLIGPLKFCGYKKETKSSEKIRVLYLPTYGSHASIEHCLPELSALPSDKFEITVKLHHGTSFLEPERVKLVKDNFNNVFDHKKNLLELLNNADVVLSDTSGAIFDALYAQVPVLLLAKPETENSLEWRLAQEGIVLVHQKDNLSLKTLIEALHENPKYREAIKASMDNLYPVKPEKGLEEIINCIMNFSNSINPEYIFAKNNIKIFFSQKAAEIKNLEACLQEARKKLAVGKDISLREAIPYIFRQLIKSCVKKFRK